MLSSSGRKISTSPLGSRGTPRRTQPRNLSQVSTPPTPTAIPFTSSALALERLRSCLLAHENLFKCTDVGQIHILANTAARAAKEAQDSCSVARSMALEAATSKLNAQLSPSTPPAPDRHTPLSPSSSPDLLTAAAVTTDTAPQSPSPPPSSSPDLPPSPPPLISLYPRPATLSSNQPRAFGRTISNALDDDSSTMPSPLVRLRMFRQNLKDMINGSTDGSTDDSTNGSTGRVPAATPRLNSDVSSTTTTSYSPSMFARSSPLSSLDESMFNETHQEENLQSFSRLKHLNTRVSSIKEELSRIVNSQVFGPSSSAASKSSAPKEQLTTNLTTVGDRSLTMEDMKLRLSQ